jgi:hypothetical protein
LIPAAIPDAAGAQSTNAVVQVECAAFTKNSNNSWTLKRRTVANYEIYGLILDPRDFRRNDINVFGVDLTQVLDQNCSKIGRDN